MGLVYVAGAAVHSHLCKPTPVDPSELKVGDHILYHEPVIKGTKGKYQHHGVVRKDGKIQHYSKGVGAASRYYNSSCSHGCQVDTGNVRVSHLDCFMKHKQRKIYRVLYSQKLRKVMTSEVGTASRSKPGSPDDIEARCEAALLDKVYQGAYNPVLFNCETVARKWVLGKDSYSKQARFALVFGASIFF